MGSLPAWAILVIVLAIASVGAAMGFFWYRRKKGIQAGVLRFDSAEGQASLILDSGASLQTR